MFVQTKITFVADDGEKFFGEGPYRLLRGVEKTGSLHQAAQQMEMSYSKAIKILKRAEEIIGCPLTDRASFRRRQSADRRGKGVDEAL